MQALTTVVLGQSMQSKQVRDPGTLMPHLYKRNAWNRGSRKGLVNREGSQAKGLSGVPPSV